MYIPNNSLALTWKDYLRHHLNPLHIMCRLPKQHRRSKWLLMYEKMYLIVLG